MILTELTTAATVAKQREGGLELVNKVGLHRYVCAVERARNEDKNV